MIYERDLLVGRDGSVGLLFDVTRPGRTFGSEGDDLREQVHRHDFYRHVDRLLRQARESDVRAAVPGNAYAVNTGGSAIALTAATAKTIMYVNAAASNQPSIAEMCVGFDGVTATAVPALVELVFGTKATNSTPGTNSTTFTPLQIRGWPTQASQNSAANTCTSEPTVLTSLKQWLLTPNGGLLVIQLPLGRETTGVASGTAISGNQVGVRVNAPAAVNARGYIEYDE